MAFPGISNAHGPSPQPTAYRSPTCSRSTATRSNQTLAKVSAYFEWEVLGGWGSNQVPTFLVYILHKSTFSVKAQNATYFLPFLYIFCPLFFVHMSFMAKNTPKSATGFFLSLRYFLFVSFSYFHFISFITYLFLCRNVAHFLSFLTRPLL